VHCHFDRPSQARTANELIAYGGVNLDLAPSRNRVGRRLPAHCPARPHSAPLARGTAATRARPPPTSQRRHPTSAHPRMSRSMMRAAESRSCD